MEILTQEHPEIKKESQKSTRRVRDLRDYFRSRINDVSSKIDDRPIQPVIAPPSPLPSKHPPPARKVRQNSSKLSPKPPIKSQIKPSQPKITAFTIKSPLIGPDPLIPTTDGAPPEPGEGTPLEVWQLNWLDICWGGFEDFYIKVKLVLLYLDQ